MQQHAICPGLLLKGVKQCTMPLASFFLPVVGVTGRRVKLQSVLLLPSLVAGLEIRGESRQDALQLLAASSAASFPITPKWLGIQLNFTHCSCALRLEATQDGGNEEHIVTGM